jgi:hypothetical protein
LSTTMFESQLADMDWVSIAATARLVKDTQYKVAFSLLRECLYQIHGRGVTAPPQQDTRRKGKKEKTEKKKKKKKETKQKTRFDTKERRTATPIAARPVDPTRTAVRHSQTSEALC